MEEENVPTVTRQHVTVTETKEGMPHLGVMAAGFFGLEEHGFAEGDRVEVTVTLKRLPPVEAA